MAGPGDGPDGKLAVALERAAWAVRGNFGQTMRSRRLTWNDYCLLSVLRETGGCTVSRLGELALQQQATTSKWLSHAEARGIVKRFQGGRDRRFVMSALTIEGAQMFDELAVVAAVIEQDAVTRFPLLADERFLAALRSVTLADDE